MSANGEKHNWTEFMKGFEAKWAIAPNCPFCGAQMKKLHSWWTTQKRYGKREHYAVQCLQCGAQAATGETPEDAVDEWSRRTENGYQPLGPHSYVLPMQKYSSLLVYEDSHLVSFIDYIDGDIQEKVDINLGSFRICYRHMERRDDEQTDIPE